MADTLLIPISDLLIDAENPRLPQPNIGQRDAQREVARQQQKKLLVLAQDIVTHGLNPADLPIVMPCDERRYVVLEGNRRLVALKALENPDSMVGAFNAALLSSMRKLSVAYQENPIESIDCLVVKDREEARHWIELRHTGQKEGAGIIPWGSDESARFRARTGKLELHTQVLDFLEHRGHLTPEQRRDVPAASFKRLIGTPELREKVGIDVRHKKLVLLGNEKQVAKALLHVIDDLSSGKTVTKHIYTKDLRVKYANDLPSDIVVTPTSKSGHDASLPTGGAQPKPKPVTAARLPKQRDKLIPRDCVLNVTESRIRLIEEELRDLSLEKYTNAVSVLFRVFIELSCDAYVNRVGLSTDKMASLSTKLQDVTNDLVGRRKLTTEQARPVRRAATRDSFLAPSLTLLNAYVHNPHVFPAPGDLRAHWDSLQPFFTAMWSP